MCVCVVCVYDRSRMAPAERMVCVVDVWMCGCAADAVEPDTAAAWTPNHNWRSAQQKVQASSNNRNNKCLVAGAGVGVCPCGWNAQVPVACWPPRSLLLSSPSLSPGESAIGPVIGPAIDGWRGRNCSGMALRRWRLFQPMPKQESSGPLGAQRRCRTLPTECAHCFPEGCPTAATAPGRRAPLKRGTRKGGAVRPIFNMQRTHHTQTATTSREREKRRDGDSLLQLQKLPRRP